MDKIQKKASQIAQKWITDDELNKYLLEVIKMQQSHFEKNKDLHGLMPELHVLGIKDPEDGGKRPITLMVLAGGGFDEHKHEIIRGIGMKFAQEGQHNAVAVFMVAEAWMRRYGKDEDLSKFPSEHDDKQEILMISGLSIDKRTNMASVVMKRDKDNIVSLGKETIQACNGKIKLESYILMRFFEGYSLGMIKKSTAN